MTKILTADDAVANRALAAFGYSADASLRMINLSENATYLIEDPGTGRNGILRVHRENYHSAQAIESELMWLVALRAETGIDTPVAIAGLDGSHVVTMDNEGQERHVVLFEMINGIEPDEATICADDFGTLGELTARLHEHAKKWTFPANFERFSWDWTHTLGVEPRWGRWQDGIGISDSNVPLLAKAAKLIRTRLEAFGSGPDRFGLVHADLRLANLLVDGDRVNVIDFDDAGFSWFLYDFGTAVSFIEDDPRLGEWQSAWVEGYRRRAKISAEEESMLSTFVMLRRFMLVAWLGSHSHSREVLSKGPRYADGTCELAERYLSSSGLSL